MSNNALSLKDRKNIHYVQNNTSKTKIIPKRYIEWRKTNSCTLIRKTPTLEKYKFMKMRSFPDILKCKKEQYSDTSLHNTSGGKKYSSIFSKICHFSFFQMFSDNKKDISSPCYSPEKTPFKKKSLFKSFPIPTKISNTKNSLRNTSISDGKCNNVPHDMKTDCTNSKTQKDKSLLTVLIFLFFFFLLGKYYEVY